MTTLLETSQKISDEVLSQDYPSTNLVKALVSNSFSQNVPQCVYSIRTNYLQSGTRQPDREWTVTAES